MFASSSAVGAPGRIASGPRYDLIDYLVRLIREKSLILLVFLPIAALGLFGAARMKTVYPVYSSVLVRLGQEYVYEPRIGDAGRGAVPAADQVIQSETEILGSPQLKQRVITKLGLARVYPKLAVKYAAGDLTEKRKVMDEALRAIDHNIKIETAPDTPVIKLSYKSENPETAALVLNTMLDEYIIYRRTVLRDTSGPAMAEQKDVLLTRLDRADRAFQAFLAANQIGDFVADKASLSQLTAQVEQQKLQAEAQLQERTARLANLSSQIEGISREVGIYRDLSGAANDKLATLRVQREDLLSRYRNDARPVQEIDSQIAQLEAGMAAGRTRTEGARRLGINPIYQTIETERVQLAADVAAQRQSVAALNGQIQQLTMRSLKMVALEPRFQQLLLDRDVLQANLREYSVKEVQGRAAQDLANLESDNIMIVNRAIPPIKGQSLRVPVAILALLFAGFTGICAGIVRMLLRPGLATRRAAERTFALPVLASAGLKAS